MKRNDYWKNFSETGKVDDYLHYIACTREEYAQEFMAESGKNKEGGLVASINDCNRNGSISHAGW